MSRCNTCKYDNLPWYEEPCDSCCGAHDGYEPKENNMSRYIDADKLIKEIKERITAAIEWGKNAETDDIKVRAEQAIATFCEVSLTAKKISTADVRKNIKAQKVIGGGERDGATCWFECSHCHGTVDIEDAYCKHCGAVLEYEK